LKYGLGTRLAVSYPVGLSALVYGCREGKNQLLLIQSWDGWKLVRFIVTVIIYLHVFHFNFLDGRSSTSEIH